MREDFAKRLDNAMENNDVKGLVRMIIYGGETGKELIKRRKNFFGRPIKGSSWFERWERDNPEGVKVFIEELAKKYRGQGEVGARESVDALLEYAEKQGYYIKKGEVDGKWQVDWSKYDNPPAVRGAMDLDKKEQDRLGVDGYGHTKLQRLVDGGGDSLKDDLIEEMKKPGSKPEDFLLYAEERRCALLAGVEGKKLDVILSAMDDCGQRFDPQVFSSSSYFYDDNVTMLYLVAREARLGVLGDHGYRFRAFDLFQKDSYGKVVADVLLSQTGEMLEEEDEAVKGEWPMRQLFKVIGSNEDSEEDISRAMDSWWNSKGIDDKENFVYRGGGRVKQEGTELHKSRGREFDDEFKAFKGELLEVVRALREEKKAQGSKVPAQVITAESSGLGPDELGIRFIG